MLALIQLILYFKTTWMLLAKKQKKTGICG